MMQLIINDKNEIISYARAGGLEDSIEFGGDLPIDFVTKFRPTLYLLKSDEIVLNPDYVAPNLTVNGPSAEMLAINTLGLQVAKLMAEKGGD